MRWNQRSRSRMVAALAVALMPSPLVAQGFFDTPGTPAAGGPAPAVATAPATPTPAGSSPAATSAGPTPAYVTENERALLEERQREINFLLGSLVELRWDRTPVSHPVTRFDSTYPAEQIRIVKVGIRQYEMRIVRNYVAGDAISPIIRTVPITEADLSRVVGAVADGKLFKFAPQQALLGPIGPHVDRLVMETEELRDRRARKADIQWMRPIENEQSIANLRLILLEIADRTAPAVPLVFFRR